MFKKLLLFIVFVFIISCKKESYQSFEKFNQSYVEKKVDRLILAFEKLENASPTKQCKAEFKECRKKYKKIELFVEYYFQGFSRRINGPALPEVKTEDNMVNEASGFQVIEEIIFKDTIDKKELNKQLNILKTDLLFVKQSIKDLPIQNHHFYEMIQHQIIRVATLGITGFDSPIASKSIDEAKYSLEGIQEIYLHHCAFNHKKSNGKISTLNQKAIAYINNNRDFEPFNRLEFIKNYLIPLSVAFENDFKTIIDITPNYTTNKVFYGHLGDLMQGKKMNTDAFSTFEESKATPNKILLGKILFREPSLSKSNAISCHTCHDANKAFTDGKVTSIQTIHSNSKLRNSPTLLYSGFQKAFFYDMRSQDLENQIENVMRNPEEFNLSSEEIKTKISGNKKLLDLFAKAYPNKKEITPFEIKNAIACYVRSLMPFQSKIDLFFKDKGTLNKSEINGFNLFTGKAKCATCHFIPLYNGTIPPWYNSTESEVIGVPGQKVWQNATIDEDLGRYQLNNLEPLKYSFKTPTLRNINKTAPYMHNGIYENLEEIIKFYELGGGNGIGMQLQNQTLSFDKLTLTANEKQDLLIFLKSLDEVQNY